MPVEWSRTRAMQASEQSREHGSNALRTQRPDSRLTGLGAVTGLQQQTLNGTLREATRMAREILRAPGRKGFAVTR